MMNETFNCSTLNITEVVNNAIIECMNQTNETSAQPNPFPIIYRYLTPTICFIGIICNIFNLLVLSQYELKESPYTYLCGLACSDLNALLLSFILFVFGWKSDNYYWKAYECYIFFPLVNVFTTSSVWLTVMLTIERFLFVRYPLWAKAKLDRASAKVKVFCIYVAALLINIPRCLVFKVDKNSKGGYIRTSTAFRNGNIFFVTHWVHNALIHFLPLIILSIANIYLVVAVQKARLDRKKLDIRNNREAAAHREQSRLTITLISIICLMLLALIPSAFADLPVASFVFGPKFGPEYKDSGYYLLQYISNTLVLCNMSLNFVLYCAFNARFRRAMSRMVRRWTKRLQNRNQSFLLLVNFRSSDSMLRNNSNQSQSITLHTKLSSGELQIRSDESQQTIKTSTSLLKENKE